jgi:hypothetical protein
MSRASDNDALFFGLRSFLSVAARQRWTRRGHPAMARRLWQDFPRLDQFATFLNISWAGNL